MMSPSLALQGEIVSALKADSTVASFVDARVHDFVPANTAFPFISIGEFQEIQDGTPCHDGIEIALTLHAWSQKKGEVEGKHIAQAIKEALHYKDFILTDWALAEIAHRQTRTIADPDGVTTHMVVEFTALLDAK